MNHVEPLNGERLVIHVNAFIHASSYVISDCRVSVELLKDENKGAELGRRR